MSGNAKDQILRLAQDYVLRQHGMDGDRCGEKKRTPILTYFGFVGGIVESMNSFTFNQWILLYCVFSGFIQVHQRLRIQPRASDCSLAYNRYLLATVPLRGGRK